MTKLSLAIYLCLVVGCKTVAPSESKVTNDSGDVNPFVYFGLEGRNLVRSSATPLNVGQLIRMHQQHALALVADDHKFGFPDFEEMAAAGIKVILDHKGDLWTGFLNSSESLPTWMERNLIVYHYMRNSSTAQFARLFQAGIEVRIPVMFPSSIGNGSYRQIIDAWRNNAKVSVIVSEPELSANALWRLKSVGAEVRVLMSSRTSFRDLKIIANSTRGRLVVVEDSHQNLSAQQKQELLRFPGVSFVPR